MGYTEYRQAELNAFLRERGMGHCGGIRTAADWIEDAPRMARWWWQEIGLEEDETHAGFGSVLLKPGMMTKLASPALYGVEEFVAWVGAGVTALAQALDEDRRYRERYGRPAARIPVTVDFGTSYTKADYWSGPAVPRAVIHTPSWTHPEHWGSVNENFRVTTVQYLDMQEQVQSAWTELWRATGGGAPAQTGTAATG
ncbi:hypothetical protein ACFC1T_09075 [Kitasatospora sp. NPDC056076]|uniref:hypothetical protein n=1 Tax=Kitasatospora sp. NPDC056076 TaxID=3345703 RepID=UPI0035DFE199